MAFFRQEVNFGLPLSAGVTIYVAASDLIPEVNHEPGVRMALVVFLGVVFCFCSTASPTCTSKIIRPYVSRCSPRAR